MVAVVTDGACDLPPASVHTLGITVVPYRVRWGSRLYYEGQDFDDGAFYASLAEAEPYPVVEPPEVGALQEAYEGAVRSSGSVIAIHLSSRLATTFANAWQARNGLPLYAGRIEVFDSQSASLGLGFMVERAAILARRGHSLVQIVRHLRRMVQETHVAFYVESLENVRKSGFLEKHPRLAEYLQDGRQILRIDEGMLAPFERVRSKAKALDALQTFVLEFPRIERLGLMYAGSRQDLEELLARLEPFYPREALVISRLGAALGSILGSGSLGVAVYEGAPPSSSAETVMS